MTPDPRLNFLVDLREAAGLTQKEVARRFDLAERQGYKSVAAWEKGESIPKARLRARFLRYLWDDLRLHKEPTRFAEYWDILVDCWRWEPLSATERATLRLPAQTPEGAPSPTPPQTTAVEGAAVQGNVTTNGGPFAGRDQYIFQGLPQVEHFVKLYRTAQDAVDEAAFAAQLTGYLRWLIERMGNIELRGVKLRDGSQTTALKLAEVYVTLNAELVGHRRQDEPKELALEQLLTTGNRLAVIGGPGCGKTTVLLYLAWVLANAIVDNNPALATAKLGLRLDKQQPTLPLPIYLPLSVYARQRFGHEPQRDSEETLADFLPTYLHRIAGSLKQLPADFIERLLTSGRHLILLLDGLDEVADEGQRRLVREAIENLVTSREGIRVAVTCRTVAFQGRTVLARGFQQINVRPLDEEQVTLLIRKAYEYQYRADPLEQQRKTSELLAGLTRLEAEHARRGSREERRLIDTPLLVRMLLVVHLSDRKLPQHRAELYKRFADTIIHADYAFDESVAEAMRKLAGNSPELLRALAFGMHQRDEQQGREIDEHDLRALLKPTFANKIDAFITLTRQRGTLLEERDGLYRFLHLAFQEFLTTCYLVDDYDEDGGFPAKIRFFWDGPILNSWWREVALLLPGYYLTVDKSRLAERFIRMLAGLDDRYPITAWSPDVQLAAAEIAATAALEWFHEDEALRQALVQRLMNFFANPSLLNQTPPRLRALAGRTLAALGDPRFSADAWFLPDDPMLGFVEMPAGIFMMGSDKRKDKDADDDETPQHKVALPTFYIARYPVTVAQFRVFVEATGEKPKWADLTEPANHPVRTVTWFEATRYCQWLTEQLRTLDKTLTPLAEKLAQGWQVLLPSEAEWERAARGSKGRRYPWGNEDVDLNRANYDETGIGITTAVGCFPAGATPEGIEELSGNVWEWTRSRYIEYPYPSDEQARQEHESVQGEGIKNSDRFVQRGGAYYSNVSSMRAPLRYHSHAVSIHFNDGFRLVVGGGAAPGS